jgi:Uma2 family endonuclease
MTTIAKPDVSDDSPAPAWDVAKMFPNQGVWDDWDYLYLTRLSNNLAELTDGRIEVLPMPTMSHQRIVRLLFQLLLAFVADHRLGEVLFAPLRVRLREGKFREPDVVFMRTEHASRMGEEYWDGADLVMEVVSEDGADRDLNVKHRDYAEAGIPEYWIVDPHQSRITVLRLADGQYAVDGEYGPGASAVSPTLPGFEVDVQQAFDAGRL